MADLTVQDLVTAARRGVISLAEDPTMRHYAPDTLALVYGRTIANMAGAGSVEAIAERIESDPALKDVPIEVLDIVVAASYVHFGRAVGAAKKALGEQQEASRG